MAKDGAFLAKVFGYVALLLVWHLVCARIYAIPDVVAIHSGGTADGGPAGRSAAASHQTSSSAPPTAVAAASCGGKPFRPFHTLLTSQGSSYQAWQARIMYYHWRKQKAAAGACGEMGGFTRLCATEGGAPDGLQAEMPSIYVAQMSAAEIARHGHFGVLNRPTSVLALIGRGWFESIPESFVYVAETDHVLLRPLPNLASDTEAAAYAFHYMKASAAEEKYYRKHAHLHPAMSTLPYTAIQPVGPSPLIIRKDELARVTPLWLNLSLALKLDPAADARFGWVLEMWGYSIAAAAVGIRHTLIRSFQLEPGGGSAALPLGDGYIFHYTYGIELDHSGRGVGGIGEWSLDKRHYGGAYPPRELAMPPRQNGVPHVPAEWLTRAFNEATAGIAAWPATKALGTYGWRRVAGDGLQMPLAARLLGTRWTWAGVEALAFMAEGKLETPWGDGVWGVLPADAKVNDGGFCAGGAPPGCGFADFGHALHNVRFDFGAEPPTLRSWRVGDGESVDGKRLGGAPSR
jgi:hypothetical protein